jgi:hypothetical protein
MHLHILFFEFKFYKNKKVKIIINSNKTFLDSNFCKEVIREYRENPTGTSILYFDNTTVHFGGTVSITTRPKWSPILFSSIDYMGDVIIVIHDKGKKINIDNITSLIENADNLRVRKVESVTYTEIVDHTLVLKKSYQENINLASSKLFNKIHNFNTVDSLSVIIPTTFSNHFKGKNSHSLFNLLGMLYNSACQDVNIENIEFILVYGDESDPLGHREFLELLNDFQARFTVNVIFCYDKSNFNFSKRINMGIQLTSNESILIVNDDVVLLENIQISKYISILKIPNVASVSSILVSDYDFITHAGVSLCNSIIDEYLKQTFVNSFDPGLHHLREVDCNTFAFIFVKKSLLYIVGALDEFLELDFNDVEWGLRATRFGFSHVIVPNFSIVHNVSLTRKDKTSGQEIARYVIKAYGLKNQISEHAWQIPTCCYMNILPSKIKMDLFSANSRFL